ncbi:MAG: hypothetical protein ACKOZM_00875 [Flavobacteriales bacterium]
MRRSDYFRGAKGTYTSRFRTKTFGDLMITLFSKSNDNITTVMFV